MGNLPDRPNFEEFDKFIDDIPDEYLEHASFRFSAAPWQHDPDSGSGKYKDPDGFTKTKTTLTREELANECWEKLHANPQVNTAVRGKAGRLTGLGFEMTSGVEAIQDIIEEVELDHRNRMHNYWPKYVVRAQVEGELFICLTCHAKGFIEVDFVEPREIQGYGDDDTGIIFHPTKTTLPLFYNIKREAYELSTKWKHSVKEGYVEYEQIPSIYIARYPSLVNIAKNHFDYHREKQQPARSRKHAFKPFGGYKKFIVAWDKSFITRRAISYLRTTLEWLNHYENLKKYEIDHKKSSGAYLWWFKIEDARAFRQWLKLSDADRKKTGIMAKKTPGSTLVTPPGITLSCINPKLGQIKDQDTDIMQMVTFGLDEASDVTTGTASGPFSSVKASRGPMTDRISDEAAYFSRFLRHDFWSSIFFLKNKLNAMDEFFMVNEAVSFTAKQEDVLQADGTKKKEWVPEPVYKEKKKRPEMLVDVSFPISETLEMEGRAKATLGTKHGPLSETLGIPKEACAERIGFGGYPRQRLKKATEDRNYPKLVYTVDAESIQEKNEAEPGKAKKKEGDKPADNKGAKK